MDWKDLATKVASAAPILGTLLGGPGGAAVGALIASAVGTQADPGAVAAALQNPDTLAKLKDIEAKRQVDLQSLLVQSEKARLQAESADIAAVNATMQAETKAEHWPSYSWRPAIGFALAINVFASTLLVLMVYVPIMFGSTNMAAAVASLPTVLGSLAAVGATTLPVIGVASWFRGKAQADPANPATTRG